MGSNYKSLRYQIWIILIAGMALSTSFLFGLSKVAKEEYLKRQSSDNSSIGFKSNFSSENIYKARCGFDLYRCKVLFKDGKLIINNTKEIELRSFKGIIKSTECRQRFILIPLLVGCLKSQYDRDFTIFYSVNNSLMKSIRISFRPGHIPSNKQWKSFQSDIKVWTKDHEVIIDN